MELGIIAVGKMKSGPAQDLFETYAKRTRQSGKAIGITSLALREFGESRARNSDTRKDEEAEALLSVSSGACLIALDENGVDMTSTEFAMMMRKFADDGQKKLYFAIGGADGHGSSLLKASAKTIRLGSMTWPHQIVRILLAEQLYRAVTILSGHPYHRS